jgi:hypothetical protein
MGMPHQSSNSHPVLLSIRRRGAREPQLKQFFTTSAWRLGGRSTGEHGSVSDVGKQGDVMWNPCVSE